MQILIDGLKELKGADAVEAALINKLVQVAEDAKQEGHSNFCPNCEALGRELQAIKQGEPVLVQNEANIDEMHAIGNGIMYGKGEQGEPVAESVEKLKELGWNDAAIDKANTPQQRTWVELTDEQINQAYADSYKGIPLHEGIVAKFKENNGIAPQAKPLSDEQKQNLDEIVGNLKYYRAKFDSLTKEEQDAITVGKPAWFLKQAAPQGSKT